MCYCREVIKEYTMNLSLPLLKIKSIYTRLVSAPNFRSLCLLLKSSFLYNVLYLHLNNTENICIQWVTMPNGLNSLGS